METYLSLRPFVAACRYADESELQKAAQGPMLVSEAVAAAWLTNTNVEIFRWIAKYVKNAGSAAETSEVATWATIIQLCQHTPLTTCKRQQIAYFIKTTTLTHENIWKTICYPRLPCLATLQDLIKLCGPNMQTWVWIWQAAWTAGDAETAKWVLAESGMCLSNLPSKLRTICIFRKPIDYELVESVPVNALNVLLETIMADQGIRTLCVEAVGGYRTIRLEWELPGRLGRPATRGQLRKQKHSDSLIPLRFHPECAAVYETGTATFKLLWMGMPPSYLEHLEKTLEVITASGAVLINVTGHCDELSSEDKNILFRTLRNYAERHLQPSRHRTNMFIDAAL